MEDSGREVVSVTAVAHAETINVHAISATRFTLLI
jgi:hypothetical protein